MVIRLLTLSTLTLMLGSIVLSQSTDTTLERIREATVFVTQIQSDRQITRCVGSGVIVRPDGVILTNAHHTVTSPTCPGDTIIISVALEQGKPPVPKYRATIAQVDEGLDLALLRITQEFDGRQLDLNSLPALPFVELVDSTSLELDTTITFVGFDDIGNAPVKSIRGTVRGFIAEPSGGEKSWVKTSSIEPVSGVMTGGGVYNESGQLIGIPTSAPTSVQSIGQTCLRIEDTNQDNIVNEIDDCIPVGDNISVLRPAEFARPLIRSASLGLIAESISAPAFDPPVVERPSISRVFSSPSVVDGIPSTVVATLPAGTSSQYLFFDYANMTPDTVYEVRVTVDGIPNDTLSLPPVKWSGNAQGLWYVGSSGQPYPNGNYEFRIFVDGVAAATYSLSIGGPVQTVPTFSNIVFGVLDATGLIAGNGYVLPTGAIATGRFIYTNMRPDLTWTVIWYYNGTEIPGSRQTNVWTLEQSSSNSQIINLQPEGGLPTGNYRVELYIESALSCTGDFVIAGTQNAALPLVFRDVEFFRADETLASDERPGTAFPDGAPTLFAQFDWQQIALGTAWRLEWLVDDSLFYSLKGPWNNSETGDNFTLSLSAPNGIPDGTYTMRLFVNNVLLESGAVSIGIGQLRIDRFASASGITLRGRIYDAETGLGISGVTFVLISADFSVADFVWIQEQIYSLAVTDRNGEFQLDRPLQLASPYSVVISADGYLPLTADGFELEEENGNPIIMSIPLIRD